MSYKTPVLNVVSLATQLQSNDGKDTASCCSGSCCYGSADSFCSFLWQR